MSKRKGIIVLATVLVATAAVGFAGGFKSIQETLSGYEEVSTGIASVSTTGNGKFTARIRNDESAIDFTLNYADMEGVVSQAHIHFGNRSTAGGISVWLCETNAAPAPASVAERVATCPGATSGTVSGTIEAVDVIGPAGQGIEALAFGELLAALRAGRTYVNVHSSKWPGGEIRAQIEHGGNGPPDND